MPKATIEYPDDIVTKNNNGGWHPKGKRAYRNAVRTIMQCLQIFKKPRLYHLCFEGKTHKMQMKMLNALVQMADRAGIKLEWFACREVADKTKKAHIHAFVIIDAYGINPYSVFNQFDDGQVGQLCIKHGINFSIFSPKDDLGIHGNTDYMTLPYQGKGNKQTIKGGERLKDALRWLAYCFKARSKPTEAEADGQIFPASRPSRIKKSLPSAPQVEKETFSPSSLKVVLAQTGENLAVVSNNESYLENPIKEKEMQLTNAQTFIASKYEQGVDQHLDVEALRLFLLSHGIKRSPAMVAHELEETYGFYGYASRWPAPAKPDIAMLDAQIDRTPLTRATSKKVWRLSAPTGDTLR